MNFAMNDQVNIICRALHFHIGYVYRIIKINSQEQRRLWERNHDSANEEKCPILCDKRLSSKLKRKIFKTVTRPGNVYGLETFAPAKRKEVELEVT